MIFSSFAHKLTADSGILQLMDDLGRPLPEGLTQRKLGGGNPCRVPEVEALYRREMESLLQRGDDFEQAISRYDAPQGRISFIQALVSFLNTEYNWNITEENIAITNGSQSAFFYLFNIFSGQKPNRKTILFPLVPEYIGYADQGIDNDIFVTLPARIAQDKNRFKYHIDIELVKEYLNEHPETGAICVSRPTNPTGNVLTDEEIAELAKLAKKHDIPLMIDNAYGMPFPDIIFPDMLSGTPAPHWDEHTILSMSLSKIGLPSLRTGIIVAEKSIIKAISALNSIVALASGSLGQIIAEGLIKSGELKQYATNYVRPFYKNKSLIAQNYIDHFFEGRDYLLHRSEGSLFLWLYLGDIRITTKELYEKLKDKGVIVVPGEYFFFGRNQGSESEIAWKTHPHRNSCIRINYGESEETVREGLKIIAETSNYFRL